MLDYMRNKTVNIVYDDGLFFAHGILDDDIYSVEVDLVIDEKNLTIKESKGRWLRFTTPDCPLAIPHIASASGIKIEKGFADKIHREIGRKACRHFANIMIECCYSVKEAKKAIEIRASLKENKEKRSKDKDEETESKSSIKEKQKRFKEDNGKKTVIDLHVHTKEASPCSSAEIEAIITEAKKKGLDGVCITDHNFVWDEANIKNLSEKHKFMVLRGNEITTDQGDILVFGMYEDIKGIISLPALRKKVLDADGVMIAAHPFRGFLAVSGDDIGLTADSASKREVFKNVDGVEILNGKVTRRENRLAGDVAEMLGLSVTGGSDVHETNEVGKYATCFFSDIKSEKDLIYAVKKGLCVGIEL